MGHLKTLLYALCIYMLAGCVNPHVATLDRIDRLSEKDPESASAALDSISSSQLSAEERHYFNLLRIKVDDKNYVTHTSDSLINSVIEHYRWHGDSGKYAESLYYGGRVYSDMGDYKTAIRYFEDALVELPEDTPHIQLRANVLSQTGRLLNKLGLNEEAIPYIEQVIGIETRFNDSINLMYDSELLGHITADSRQYKKSDSAYRKALQIAIALNNGYELRERMHLAALKQYEGKIDSAVSLIRGVPEKVDESDRPLALGYAAGIYFHAGIADTAAMYAQQLTKYENIPNVPNIDNAYYYLANPRLRDYVQADSIPTYIDKYQIATEKYMETNGDRAALLQNSLYNYQRHDRDKAKALASRNRWIAAGVTFGVALMILTILYLILLLRNKKNMVNLLVARDNIRILSESLTKQSDEMAEMTREHADEVVKMARNHEEEMAEKARMHDAEVAKMTREHDEAVAMMTREHDKEIAAALSPDISALNKQKLNIHDLRESILNKCKDIIGDTSVPVSIPAEILNSEVYSAFRKSIRDKKPVPPNSPMWMELEEVIDNTSPKFLPTIRLLAGKLLKPEKLYTLLLLKCGFQPGQIEILISLSGSGVTSRRARLAKSLFGIKLEPAVFDRLIRML